METNYIPCNDKSIYICLFSLLLCIGFIILECFRVCCEQKKTVSVNDMFEKMLKNGYEIENDKNV